MSEREDGDCGQRRRDRAFHLITPLVEGLDGGSVTNPTRVTRSPAGELIMLAEQQQDD